MSYTFYFPLALQFLYEVSVPFNESTQDINFSLLISFLYKQYISRGERADVCGYQIIEIAQYLLQYCHRLKFPIISIFLL